MKGTIKLLLLCFPYLLLCLVRTTQSQTRPLNEFPRKAPFCVDPTIEPDMKNFVDIMKYHDAQKDQYLATALAGRSPTGLINDIELTRIHIHSTAESFWPHVPDFEAEHPYRTFFNYFHITIKAVDPGIEGLFVQAIGAPIGVPFGEFVLDWSCGDCSQKTESLQNYSALVPCLFTPAASYLHPTTLVIGGGVNIPDRFREAHFHFRYVDYPCFDVTHAQFLIIAVKSFKHKMYDIFFSSIYKVSIEGVGAPFPMYYGLDPKDRNCHDPVNGQMRNWKAIVNPKAKIKYSQAYDECTFNKNINQKLGNGMCPPGPVTCSFFGQDKSNLILSAYSWRKYREGYLRMKDAKNDHVKIICRDCGEYKDYCNDCGTPPDYSVTTEDEFDQTEAPNPILRVVNNFPPFDDLFELDCWDDCEDARKMCVVLDMYGNAVRIFNKDKNDTRFLLDSPYTIKKMDICRHRSFDGRLARKGKLWGQNIFLFLHEALMVFTWTVACNCLIYASRFMKEASFAEKGSGCFGIGKWMWDHFLWMYIAIMTCSAAYFVVAFADIEILCRIYDKTNEDDTDWNEKCLESAFLHNFIGLLAIFFFVLSFVTGWYRPEGSVFRMFLIVIHMLSGYAAKILGIVSMFFTNFVYQLQLYRMVFLGLIEGTFIGFCVAGTIVQYLMDRQMQFRVRDRKCCPLPEGIDTFTEPPMRTIRALLYPALIVVQVLCFLVVILDVEDLEDIPE